MNNLETEFKFKINKLPTINFDNTKKYYFKQTYFDGNIKKDLLKNIFPDVDFSIINTYRIRYIESADEKKIVLTIKSKAFPNGFSRIEEEKEIDERIASLIIDGTMTNTIIKNRYVDAYNGYIFEFDEYLNLNVPLFTCEIEVCSDVEYEKEVNKFQKMIEDHYEVQCRDVTFNPIYKNSNLHKYFGK